MDLGHWRESLERLGSNRNARNEPPIPINLGAGEMQLTNREEAEMLYREQTQNRMLYERAEFERNERARIAGNIQRDIPHTISRERWNSMTTREQQLFDSYGGRVETHERLITREEHELLQASRHYNTPDVCYKMIAKGAVSNLDCKGHRISKPIIGLDNEYYYTACKYLCPKGMACFCDKVKRE